MTVYGKPGKTLPEHHMDVYAYVIISDVGIFAADSHEATHLDDEKVTNKSWHGHKVTIKKNAGPNGADCVTEIGSFMSQSRFEGNTLFITNVESNVIQALTVRLELLNEDPDSVPEGECVAEIKEIFDVTEN